MRTTNPGGFVFLWPAGSDIVEVYHDHDPFDAPIDAIYVGDVQRSEGSLKRIANESPEYARF